MANIDDYISSLIKNNSFEGTRLDSALEYKKLLKNGREIIARIEEIQKKYPDETKVENYNEEDKQEVQQLKKELDEVQKQQDKGYISFDVPNQYKENGVSVYKYQKTGEAGKNIISEMEKLRIKYYPNVSTRSFSQDDKSRYEQFEKQLNELQKTQKELKVYISYYHAQDGDIEAMKTGMINRTDSKIPEITRTDLMDSDFLLSNFKESMRIAQIAVDAELNALNNGDYKRAMDCMKVYSVAYSNFSAHYWGDGSSKQLTEYIENKLGEKHKEILQQKVEKYQALSTEMSNEEIISQFSDFRHILKICHTLAGSEEKSKAEEILSRIANDKIAQLDKKLAELKEHIELPENEAKIDKIQVQIEELEIATGLGHTLEQSSSKHKSERIEEQGIDISEIMSDIHETAELKGRISQSNYDRINEKITQKSEYLEKKLAYLQQYRDIPGNEERIAELESQIETMQDSWVVASNGVDLQAVIDKNNIKLDEKRVRLLEAEKELAYTIKYELAKVGLISRLRYEVKELMEGIDKLENENSSIQNGTNKRYIGEHHKGRIDNDEKIKAEQEEKIRLQRERIEKKQKEISEQEEGAKAEREEKIKKAKEEWDKNQEEQRLKREQKAKEESEKQARIKVEQEEKAKAEKERQMDIEKNIREYKQYEELTTRKPEIEELYNQLFYEDFSSQVKGHISENMETLMKKVKDLPDEEKNILLSRYNKNATYQINEQGLFADEEVRKKAEQEAKAKVEEQARIKAEQEAKAKVEEQARIKAEQEVKAKAEKQARIKAEQEGKAKAEEQARIKAEQEGKAKAEEQARIKAEQEAKAKTYEQQQLEKIKPREKSIKDEVGDELKKTEQEMQEVQNPTVDLWMNRFSGWYGAIDRVTQNAKAKFVKMKSDIVKAISDRIKERTNSKQKNIQEQDSSER